MGYWPHIMGYLSHIYGYNTPLHKLMQLFTIEPVLCVNACEENIGSRGKPIRDLG